MNKKLKWGLILTPVLIGIILVAMYYKNKNKSSSSGALLTYKPSSDGRYTLVGNSSNTTSGSGSACSFPIKSGSANNCVLQLQKALLAVNPDYLPVYGADGIFGSETKAALMDFYGKDQIASQSEFNSLITMIYGD